MTRALPLMRPPGRSIRAVLLVLPLLFVLPLPAARADIVHLRSGGRVEGTVRDLGEKIEVRHRYGSFEVAKSDVLRIEVKKTLRELYEEKLAAIEAGDPAARVEIGLWLREEGWEEQARKEFEAALGIDPDHPGANAALGRIRYEGEWRTEREIMEMRGYVLVDGEWITRRELKEREAAEERRRKAEEAEKERKAAVRALVRRVRADLWKIANGTAKQAEAGRDDLVTLAREMGSGDLEQLANDAKAYYDRYWQIVRESALTEVRAQVATLKRPIPTFQTSLGASSSPVTLQLPEVSLISIGTTVRIPAGR